MSYLVLARKYRPQTFAEVVGQEHVIKTLLNAIKRGRIHHAYLFCGGRGTGKTTTARLLAKALSCQNAPTTDPCNQCPACVEITQGTSVDVHEIDAASQNRVEDIRELREAIRYAPVRGKKKLYILDEVHMLSTSAFNALLKTLEEPPPHALFVFATTDPHKLPQTILSRVQRYDFKLVATAKLVEHLADVLTREHIEFEPSALYIIAREGGGSVRDSLSLLDQVLASADGKITEALTAEVLGVADRQLILSLGRALASRDAGAALSLVEDAYRRGYDLAQLARTLLAHLRDLVVMSVVKDPLPLLEIPSSELTELEQQAQAVKGRSEQLFERMIKVAEDTARAALPRYVLDVGLVDLCTIEPLLPIADLVDRLEQLEDHLARGGATNPTGGGSMPGGKPSLARSAAPSPSPSHRTSLAHEATTTPHTVTAGPASLPAQAVAAQALTTSVAVAQTSPTLPQAAPQPPVPRFSAADTPALAHVAPADPASAVAAHVAPPEVSRPIPATSHTPPDATIGEATPEPAHLPSETPPGARPALAFAGLIKAVLDLAPYLAFLHDAREVSFADGLLVLGLPSELSVTRAKEQRPRLLSLLQDVLGQPIGLELVHDAQAAQDASARMSLAETEAKLAQTERTRRQREAQDHPALKTVREVFPDVLWMEPEIDEINAEELPHVQSI